MTRGPALRFVVLATLAAALSTSGCGEPAPASEAPARAAAPIPVRTVEARVASGGRSLRTSGTVASRAESDLTFKVAGYVAEIRVDEGDRVARGQVLARLQTTEVAARLRAAEARAELAEKQLRRMERLFADSVVPEVQLDEARSAHDGARAELEVARFDHAYATIRAPSDGRILSRSVEVAEFATPGAPAFRFGSTDEGWVARVYVADHQIVRVALGATARVALPGLAQEGLAGRVVEVADAADPRSGTFEIEVEIEAGPDPRLRSGMIAEVDLEFADPGVARVELPLQAVVDARGRQGVVFVVEGDRARRREVRIVDIGADRVGIEGDALAGARVVTAGAAYLRDGDVIAPVPTF